MKQGHQAVLLCDPLDDFHGQLVVVHSHVRGGEYRCQFELCRRHFVVLGLCQDAQLPELLVQVVHERLHAAFDRAEIVVFHLLALGSRRTEQRAAGILKVLALAVVLLVNQEVFLFRSDGRVDGLDILIAKQLQDPHGLFVDGFHGAQQRRFLVQCMPGIRAESRRDAQHTVFDECRAGGIPRCIAPGFKCGPQTAGGETRCIRFALDQFLSGKRHDDFSIAVRVDEAVVFLSCDSGHGLEPVCIVSGAFFQSPAFHGMSHCVGNLDVQRLAFLGGFLEFTERILRKTFTHGLFVKDVLAEDFGYLIHNVSPSCL